MIDRYSKLSMDERTVSRLLHETGLLPCKEDAQGNHEDMTQAVIVPIRSEEDAVREAAIRDIAVALEHGILLHQSPPLAVLQGMIDDWASTKAEQYHDLPGPAVLLEEKMRRCLGFSPKRPEFGDNLLMSFFRPISAWLEKDSLHRDEMKRIAFSCFETHSSDSKRPPAAMNEVPTDSLVASECVTAILPEATPNCSCETRPLVPKESVTTPPPLLQKESLENGGKKNHRGQTGPIKAEPPARNGQPVTSVKEEKNKDSKVVVISPPTSPTQPPSPVWKFLPVPDEPDKHTEYDVRSMTSPEGMLILGSRARGRKHKHEGTNCDDWFEFAVAGRWSILAVADGGGSYKFSRVGAQAACQGSVSFLSEKLANLVIKPRNKLTEDIQNDEDIKGAKAAIQEAMRAGWQSIEAALKERENSKAHYKVMQHRDMTLRDLYSTLLLVIHATFQTDDGMWSLIFSCAGGDGMVAAITRDGDSKLLMKTDSGEFGGEVEFLGPRMLTDTSLAGRTLSLACRARAVMLMTDGVADDYFPNGDRMTELYSDLVLNGIIPAEAVSEEKVLADLKTTKLPDIASIEKADILVECERLLPQPEIIKLASAKKYAEALGVEPQDLAKRPGLLAASLRIREKPMPGISAPEERLLVWLDSYQVRGSFDDRTMIVMTGGV